jgi:hypothetical protein
MRLDQLMWRPLQNIYVTVCHMKDNFTMAACGAIVASHMEKSPFETTKIL